MKYGFFAFILAFFLSMMAYILVRGGQASNYLSPTWKNIYIISSIVLFLLFFVGMIFGNYFPLTIAKTITFLGDSFLLVLVYLTLSFLATDILLLINKLFPLIKTDIISFRFWAMMISVFVIFVAMIMGNYKFNHPNIVHLKIETEKAKKNKSIKIVALSDVHLGISIDKKRLKKYVEMINEQQPDLVLIAGDLIDRSIQPVVKQKMEEELLQIKAPMGIYAIFGNHEHFGEGTDIIANFYEKAGIKLLIDSVVLVQNQFYIAGRDDKTNYHRKNLGEILQNIDKSQPIILLDHQPSDLKAAEENKVDLQISGHTHNGQFFPGNLIVKQMFELGYGYLKKGKTNYYVSSGLGLWGPQYRIGSQSELVVINFNY
ncbi:Metallophosphoesterase [uncultured Paludibacter sp.]|uniref:Metallophosphoesterase n=1 Tax=uncultured Paludibacter sp. TaxID=497635 RepID=A0A653AGX7_9BACT|nr:Metallophosphoesterase [uncultured Paludibacter sp.]